MSSCVRSAEAIRELAAAISAAGRPVHRSRATALCAYMIGFADAQKTQPSWPVQGPPLANSRIIDHVAKFLEDSIRLRGYPALANYECGNGTFDALDLAVRGLLDG